MAATDIKSVLELLRAKVHSADSSTSLDELNSMVKAAQLAHTPMIRHYDSDGSLPTATSSEERLAFITSTGDIKLNNSRRWENVGAEAPPPPTPQSSDAVKLWRILISGTPSHSDDLFDISASTSGAAAGQGLGIDTDNDYEIDTNFLETHSHKSDGSVIAGYDRYGMFSPTGNPLTGSGVMTTPVSSNTANSISNTTNGFMKSSDGNRVYMYVETNSFMAIGFQTAKAINTATFLRIATYGADTRPDRTPTEMKLQWYSGDITGTYDSLLWYTYATLSNTAQSAAVPYYANITDGSTITAAAGT